MEILYRYFPQLSVKQVELFAQLLPLYTEWNEKINVISRKDIDSLYEKHVVHSLSISKIIDFVPQTAVLDVGTGGGFPGIPLAIMFPEVEFHLVDSIGKKINVVNEVAHELKLNNVKAEHVRAEQIDRKYDFVVSRAVTKMDELYGWVHKKIKKDPINRLPNGIITLKGGDLDEELIKFKNTVIIYDLKDYFTEEFFETKKIVYLPMSVK